MRIFVRCDQDGNIISVMKVAAMDNALDHPYGFVEEGEVVVEVPAPKGTADIDSHEIVALYKVDLKEKKLRKLKQPPVRKPATKGSKKVAKKSRRKART